MVDSLLYMFSTCTLLGFCCIVFDVFPLEASYVRVIVYASYLLMSNNLVTFDVISPFSSLWSETGNSILNEPLNMRGAYAFTMVATSLSSVYANTFYLQPYIKAHDEKQALGVILMEEEEITLQSQLNSLRL